MPRRDADGSDAAGDVAGDHGARADDRPGADAAALQDGGAESHVGAVGDLHVAAQDGS